MKNIIGYLGAAAILAGIAVISHDVGAAEPAEWSLTNCKGGKANSGVSCDLKNTKNNKCLVPVHHAGQVEWDFAACGDAKAQLVSKAGGAIKYGEPVALKLGGEFYRKCQNPQLLGVSVCSDATGKPEDRHFTWKITGGTSGEPVASGAPFSLYNTERKDSIVFAKRVSKIADTCWADQVKLGQCIAAHNE